MRKKTTIIYNTLYPSRTNTWSCYHVWGVAFGEHAKSLNSGEVHWLGVNKTGAQTCTYVRTCNVNNVVTVVVLEDGLILLITVEGVSRLEVERRRIVEHEVLVLSSTGLRLRAEELCEADHLAATPASVRFCVFLSWCVGVVLRWARRWPPRTRITALYPGRRAVRTPTEKRPVQKVEAVSYTDM